MRLSTAVKPFLLLTCPFLLWCWLYRAFLTGSSPINEDTFSAYALVKYFLTNVRGGILPHWVPFIHWGMADVYQVGEFNPLWLFTLAVSSMGVHFYQAFVLTISLYFWLGCLGVFTLARMLFRDGFSAYLAYLLFMFSCVGMTVFSQVNLILIFVPAVWFFGFLCVFYREGTRRAALAAGFALMLVLTTYIPFYFIIAGTVALAAGLFLYGAVCLEFFRRCAVFVRKHPVTALVAAAGITAAGLEAFLNWTFLRSDFVALARPAVMNYAAVQDSGIPIEEIARDTSLYHLFLSFLHLPALAFVPEIFTLRNIPPDDQRIFYVPLLAHLALAASCFIRVRRAMVFWACGTLVLFMIALAGLTPVYAFLFAHVPIFATFRNIFFLTPFIVLTYLFLAVEVWQAFWMEAPARRPFRAAGAAAVLLLYWWYWFRPGYFLPGASATIAGLLLLLVLRFSGRMAPGGVLAKAGLAVLAVAAPVEVLGLHGGAKNENASVISNAVRASIVPFQFNYVRPAQLSLEAPEALDRYHLYNWYLVQMQDEPGNSFPYGYAARWSHELAGIADSIPGFKAYARHKFVLYDGGEAGREYASAEEFAAAFPAQTGRVVGGPGQGVDVTRFNANQVHLTVDLPSRTLLVYNDSYHPQWHVRVDGSEAPLLRANFAFKGVWVPPGRHTVRFDFEPAGGNLLIRAVILIFLAYFVFTVYALVRRL